MTGTHYPLVFVDVSWLAYRARYAMDGLSFDDMPTGVLFGVFEQLRTICLDGKVNSNRLHMFFDSKQSFRRKAYPEYKRGRRADPTPEEQQVADMMHDQIRLLRRKIFPSIGLPCYMQSGLESDDLIAEAARKIPGSETAIIITADQDLYQCISDLVSWYNPASDSWMGVLNLWRHKDIDPSMWARVKAIAGCTTDNVQGVPGVGEKTAIEHILGRLNPEYKRAKAIVTAEGKRIIRRNLKLVRLPHAKTTPFKLQKTEWSAKAFRKMCEQYGFESYTRDPLISQWQTIFAGEIAASERIWNQPKPPKTRKRGKKR